MLQALVGALEAWPHSNLTCHATLQCLVALCKDNAMMKANMTVTALKPVLQVLHTCGSCSAIAERGFTLLAVLQVFTLQPQPDCDGRNRSHATDKHHTFQFGLLV